MAGGSRRPDPYVVALISIAVAIGVRTALDPVLGDRQPFVACWLAVVVAARYGGIGPGLLATALGGLAGTFFFVPVRLSLRPAGVAEVVGVLSYMIVASAIAALGGSTRR